MLFRSGLDERIALHEIGHLVGHRLGLFERCPRCELDGDAARVGIDRRLEGHRQQREAEDGREERKYPDTDDPEPVILEIGEPFPATASGAGRSEEHTSELQSLMRISYAVFCLKQKK